MSSLAILALPCYEQYRGNLTVIVVYPLYINPLYKRHTEQISTILQPYCNPRVSAALRVEAYPIVKTKKSEN